MIFYFKFTFILLAIINSSYSDIFDIRLAEGNTTYTGRLEIYYNGKWGTVCNDGWTDFNSHVVCRQLGFGPLIRWFSFTGNESQPIHLDEVVCYGLEPSLSLCSYSRIGEHNCNHFEDIGVECNEVVLFVPQLLDGVYSNSGRLEFIDSSGFSRICNNTAWTSENSQVTCEELGYNRIDVLRKDYNIKNGVTPYKYQFKCMGDETELWHCDHAEVESPLACSKSVVLQCSSDSLDDNYDNKNVRLGSVDGNTQGFVEAYLFGVWGTMCSLTWSKFNSEVVCRELGFEGVEQDFDTPYVFDSLSPSSSENHLHKFTVRCNGNEPRLQECAVDVNNVAYGCGRDNDVALTCRSSNDGLSGGAVAGIIFGVLAVTGWLYSQCCGGRRQQSAQRPPSNSANTQSTASNGTTPSAPQAEDLPPSYDNVISNPDAFQKPDDPVSPCTPPPAYVNIQYPVNDDSTNTQQVNNNV